jgi:hypothetical protein
MKNIKNRELASIILNFRSELLRFGSYDDELSPEVLNAIDEILLKSDLSSIAENLISDGRNG